MTGQNRPCDTCGQTTLWYRTGRWQTRANSAVLGSWDDMIDQAGPRSGMFVGRAGYALDRSFVKGFGVAMDDDARAIAHLFARLREYLDSR